MSSQGQVAKVTEAQLYHASWQTASSAGFTAVSSIVPFMCFLSVACGNLQLSIQPTSDRFESASVDL